MNSHRCLATALIFCTAATCACQKASTVQADTRNIAAEAKPPAAARRQLRATGVVEAVRAFGVRTPQISGQNGRLTLTHLVPNGIKVAKGDVLAEFDQIQQLDAARDAKAKYEDFGHQADQRRALNESEAAKRAATLQQADADLAKALLQLRKGPLLAEIERLKNEVRAEDAKARVASLKKSNGLHDKAEAAALRVLELQRDRQKVALDRALNNSDALIVKAPLGGMVALENVWRQGTMGHAQEGDQLFSGQTLVRIFDPSQMAVTAMVGEPDGGLLVPGAKAKIRLDAYPDLEFTGRLTSASPVAAAALGSPIKTFAARFTLEQVDPHLLPDMSAAIIIEGDTK
ncbi:MAG: HlyD family secretion protein [Bryobacteraceae bacterium]